MAHIRKRYLEEKIKKCMDFSPLVGVLGHRKVGKTTVLERLSKNYYVLDTKEQQREASEDPAAYLKKRAKKWTALDECQTVPELFPELKEWVREHKQPGQILLSGSIRFTSRDAIRESLTGRIVSLELLPFTVSELDEAPLSHFCPDVLETENLDSLLRQAKKSTELIRLQSLSEKYFKCGGLPGICFIRDSQLRDQKISEYINTLLDRDLRLVKKITLSLSDLKAILTSLALQQGNPIDYTRIKNETGISTPTIKKVIYALEAIFMIRTIPIQGSTRGFTIYFEDMAEHRSLFQAPLSRLDELTHFCFTQIRAQFDYVMGETTRVFQYHTRAHAFVPIAFSNRNGTLGILPVASPSDLPAVRGTIDSFFKNIL